MTIGSISLSNFISQATQELKPKVQAAAILTGALCAIALVGRSVQIYSRVYAGGLDPLRCVLAVATVGSFYLAYICKSSENQFSIKPFFCQFNQADLENACQNNCTRKIVTIYKNNCPNRNRHWNENLEQRLFSTILQYHQLGALQQICLECYPDPSAMEALYFFQLANAHKNGDFALFLVEKIKPAILATLATTLDTSFIEARKLLKKRIIHYNNRLFTLLCKVEQQTPINETDCALRRFTKNTYFDFHVLDLIQGFLDDNSFEALQLEMDPAKFQTMLDNIFPHLSNQQRADLFNIVACKSVNTVLLSFIIQKSDLQALDLFEASVDLPDDSNQQFLSANLVQPIKQAIQARRLALNQIAL